MRLIALLVILGVWMPKAGAVECPPPAMLKQADGNEDSLHSWCEVNGKRDGTYEVVSLRKGLELRANYRKNELDGQFKRYAENNTITVEGLFAAGQMSGEWTRYWTNGAIRDRGSWKDDKPIGPWRSFNEKGKLEREVTYDAEGKIIAKQKSKPKEKLTSADRWRLRAGYVRTHRSHAPDASGLGVGADLRLFGFGRWFRADIDARILPDYKTEIGTTHKKVHSGQLALSLDLFPNVTDPVVFYVRFGLHLIDFSKTRELAGVGLRYHFTNKRQNWVPNGIFAELSGSDGDHDNGGQSSGSGPGPGSNSNNNQGGGAEILFAGALWSFF